ncbi:hypothetical protein JOE61_002031 [Nocardioides salarius]|uniref:DUF2877 domain-containing protein n=1 Tax=Nocardioides salarius TaxID=374513 RepID=A0ABS2MAP5_9ACTN|nr:DUF2877 domain-containing protein [Nocardioides salarius]MBM7508217.1 hypothetical protein [Nocardioides salarius]
MSTHRRVVAAAPALVGELLAGPVRTVPVLHRGVDAVYLDLRGSTTAAAAPDLAVLGVLSATASAVPCGLQTTLPRLPGDVAGATQAVLGGGQALLGDTAAVVTRVVDATVPRLPDAALDPASRVLADLVGDRTSRVRAELPAAALAALAAGSADCVPVLLGRGSGLTPVGDDVLCGWLAAAFAARAPVALALADAVRRHAPAATTALSATLLGCATRGEVLPQFRRLVLDLADPAPDLDVRVAVDVDALLRVGHTSGAGLLLGASIALHHLASRSLTP